MGDNTGWGDRTSPTDVNRARTLRRLSVAFLVGAVATYVASFLLTASAEFGFLIAHGGVAGRAAERAFVRTRIAVLVPISLLVASLTMALKARLRRWSEVWWIFLSALLLLSIVVYESYVTLHWS